jgi:hypothetical protein
MKGPNHKRRILCFIAISFTLLFTGEPLLAGKEAKIKFNEESWDFGNVKQGKILTHVFVFQNTGNSPLLINKVLTSCGCAAALVSEKRVEPGKKGKIKVTLNTRGYEGTLTKYIYVESNDPKQQQKQLTISADIDVPPRPKIDLDRYSHDLGLILDSEDIHAVAGVKNKGELELSVEFFHRDAAFFLDGKEITSPVKIASGKVKQVEVRIPFRNKQGLIREYVLLKSNDPMRPNLSLYLSGYVVSKKQLKQLFEKYKQILK